MASEVCTWGKAEALPETKCSERLGKERCKEFDVPSSPKVAGQRLSGKFCHEDEKRRRAKEELIGSWRQKLAEVESFPDAKTQHLPLRTRKAASVSVFQGAVESTDHPDKANEAPTWGELEVLSSTRCLARLDEESHEEFDPPSTPKITRRRLSENTLGDDEERQRAKEELMGAWRQKLAEVESDLAEKKQHLPPTTRKKASSVAVPQSTAASADRFAALKQAQAERRRKVAESAAALANREQEMDNERREREQAGRQKAEADEAFFTRWLQDSEEQLRAAREELVHERGLAAQAAAEHERMVHEMSRARAAELERVCAEHTKALERHGMEVDELLLESQRKQASSEETWKNRVAEAVKELASVREELSRERRSAAEAKALSTKAIAENNKGKTQLEVALERALREQQQYEIGRVETEVKFKAMLSDMESKFDSVTGELAQRTIAHKEAVAQKERAVADMVADKERSMAEVTAQKDRAIADLRQAHAEELGKKIVECAELVAKSDLKIDRLQRECQDSAKQKSTTVAELQCNLIGAQEEVKVAKEALADSKEHAKQSRVEQDAAHACALQRQQDEHAETLLQQQQESSQQLDEARRKIDELENARLRAEELWQGQCSKITEELQRARNAAAEAQDARCERLASEMRQAHSDEIAAESRRWAAQDAALRSELEASRTALEEAVERHGRADLALQERLGSAEDRSRSASAELAAERGLAEKLTGEVARLEAAAAAHQGQAECLRQQLADAQLQRAEAQAAWRSEAAAVEARLDEARKVLADEQLCAASKEAAVTALEQENRTLHAVQRKKEAAEREHAETVQALRAQLARGEESMTEMRMKHVDESKIWQARLATIGLELSAATEAYAHERRNLLSARADSESAMAELRRSHDQEVARKDMEHAEEVESMRKQGEVHQKHKQDLMRKDAEHELALAQCAAQVEKVRLEARREREHLELLHQQREQTARQQEEALRHRSAEQDPVAAELVVQVEEAERQIVETDIAWRVRLEAVEQDLRMAQEELWQERSSTRQAQADGERAVLRTIEGFWHAQLDRQACQ